MCTALDERTTMAERTSNELHTVDLDLHPNEASDLLPVENERLIAAHGWDRAFWTVLDEGAVENCVALVGHSRGEGEDEASWGVARPRFRVKRHEDATEDAEACARHGGWIYLIGSQYGGKSGPLEGKRAFLARFRENDLDGGVHGAKVEMQVAMNKLRLHRAVNDALGAFGPELLGPGPKIRKRYLAAKPNGVGKRARGRILKTDVPINVEGAAFDDEGALLLGLRYPVTAGGNPIIVELMGVERSFEDRRAAPVARRFWVVANVGSREAPTGFRALHRRGRELHAIVGSLDSVGKDSCLLEDHPTGGNAMCSHIKLKLSRAKDGGAVDAETVQTFDLPNVEGLATGAAGRFYYVTDEDDRVHIRLMRQETARRERERRASAAGLVKADAS